ncbi:MAG TPA: VOC family protein [Burkholderiales bacterium]|nr:VOC family protein [Burkholderiales bacterium]
MSAIALDLDHAGIAVRNLDAGRQAFLRLGFTLTQRSHHQGSRTPGGPIEPWGSANHCAMLSQGYLEVVGLVDAAKFSNVKGMVARYEGAHIVAFRPRSVAAAYDTLTKASLPVDAPRDLERMAPYGPDAAESRRVAFRNMYLTKSIFTEAQFQYTEHLTRDAMWQPHLLVHPNGALALQTVFLCAPEPQATAQKLAPMLGVVPGGAASGEWQLAFSNSSIRVLSPAAWARWAPDAPLPPLPAPVGVGIRVESLRATQHHLERNAVPCAPCPGPGLRVAQAYAGGAVLVFFERGA